MAEKIDLNTLPKGLTKEEFTALPNFKKIRSFFTWSGVVSIGSGILICSEYGKVCQSVLRAGGYHGRLQDMDIDQKEGLQRITSVDHGSFFDFYRNRFYKSAEHKYRKTCAKSEIDHPDIPWHIQM